MATHPLAGQPAPRELWIDPAALEAAYYDRTPDLSDANQRVAFGTSGHRGCPLDGSFNDAHIAAITQAVCDYRQAQGDRGELFLGKDTHLVSSPAERTALEVLAANRVDTFLTHPAGFTPTPVISNAIIRANRGRNGSYADGLVLTPSHNPPRDGGFKYNPPHGGPADTDATGWIQDRANELLANKGVDIRRIPYAKAATAATTHIHDFITPYVEALGSVLNLDAIRAAGLRIGVDPLGGASIGYWAPIAERFGLDLTVVNQKVDPTFGFMTLDHDGKIRMDCSSPFAMASLVGLKDKFDIAFGNDPDADRHGIVTRSRGLMNPNHYLAVAIRYLLGHRPGWPAFSWVGKTAVSSTLIDRVVHQLGRQLKEVPVGFKWFAPGLSDGTCCFGGEESAGASFLAMDGSAWSTDKDGLILGLLAAEMTAVTGRDPGVQYAEITGQLGEPVYTRIDAPASPEQKSRFKKLTSQSVRGAELAGEPITSVLTHAPGNGASLGGLKVMTENGWFAARPSGTENIYKLYAESFRGASHLEQILAEAQGMVSEALK
jgi:phosphoglucomutase